MSEQLFSHHEAVSPEVADEQLGTVNFHDDDPAKDYFEAISKTPLLSAEEEVELSKIIEAGLYAQHKLESEEQSESDVLAEELAALARAGIDAKNLFIQANLRLVVSIAKKYKYTGVPILEIIQEGNTGLIRAVEKFDYTKGYKFSTYGTWWIKQSIMRSVPPIGRDIRLPVHVYEKVVQLNKVQRDLTTLIGRDPTNAELAEELGVTEQKIEDLLQYGKTTISLNKKVGNDDDIELVDLLAEQLQQDEGDNDELRDVINDVLGMLSDREAEIIQLRFGLNGSKKHDLRSIGRELGVTAERIRQIELVAKEKLKEALAMHPATGVVEQFERKTKDTAA